MAAGPPWLTTDEHLRAWLIAPRQAAGHAISPEEPGPLKRGREILRDTALGKGGLVDPTMHGQDSAAAWCISSSGALSW